MTDDIGRRPTPAELDALGEVYREVLSLADQAIQARLTPDVVSKRLDELKKKMSAKPPAEGSRVDPAARPDEYVGCRGVTACHIVGISYRQLDYWAQTSLVTPTISGEPGSDRLYSVRDLVVLKVVKRLLDAGVPLQNIRTAIETLRTRGLPDLAGITLISDGTTVYECRSPEEVVDLLQGGQGVFGVAIGGAFREIQNAMISLTGDPARPNSESDPNGDPGANAGHIDELASRRVG